ncbi:MAG: hypothetical protein IPL40_12080 [Proteobacteria bacterium]|nr:hypothetical protein [Pseudomonadota bacterium]
MVASALIGRAPAAAVLRAGLRSSADRRIVALAAAVAVGWLAGCVAPQGRGRALAVEAPGPFFAPAGVAVAGRWVLVANTGFHYERGEPAYGAPFLTVIDRATRRVVGTVPLTGRNPQHVTVVGDMAYVVSSGVVQLDRQRGLATVVEGGGIELLELGGSTPPRAVAAYIPLGLSPDDARIGAYGALAVSPDGRLGYLGSGTRADVFVVDLAARRVLRGPERPIIVAEVPSGENGLTVTRRVGDRLAVIDFNDDALCLSEAWDAALADRNCQGVGTEASLLEGPIDVAAADAAGHTLLLAMTLANAVYRVQWPAGTAPSATVLAGTGLANNRVVVHDGYGYVVNSLSNNLQRIDLRDGRSSQPFTVLPVGSNPYDLAISEEPAGPRAWVTLFATNELALIDLRDGQVIERLGATASPPAEDAGAARPDASAATPLRADAQPLADAGIGDLRRGDGPLASCDGALAAPLVGIGAIVRWQPGPGAGHGASALPGVIQGGPTGGGARHGAVEGVLAFGVGGELIVDFGDHEIIDGSGPDFIVFENAFETGPFSSFSEPAVVGLSRTSPADGAFKDFPCDLAATSGDAAGARWPHPGCAGVRAVLANVGRNCLTPTDPTQAGGDAFDLATLGWESARWLRLRDAGIAQSGLTTKGFDLDAVLLINYRRRPTD